ncbi:XAC2610-related protein [Paraburkholderia sediminicola]|uniref:XAC2610-related protein n=1 Tax=Paraburkholderia sediminicola TaxID=458836 RepID=UPI0038BE00B8
MKAILVALAITAVLIGPASATDSLAPGIYRLETDSYRSAAEKLLEPSGERYQNRFEHAIPESAKVTYAVVSHNPESGLNKLTFLADKEYKFDPNTTNRLCAAYALPDWNEYSTSEPFCRTNIGSTEYEAALKWTAATFTVSWRPKREFLRVEHVQPQHQPTPEEIGACAIGVCERAAYGQATGLYEVTYYTDRFTRETTRPYRDILYLDKAVPVYTLTDRKSVQGSIDAGNYVAILSTDPEWYETDRFSTDGVNTHGWINRDDIFDIRWITQKAETKDFRFRVAFRPNEDASEPAWPVAIEVIDRRTNRRVQVIRDFYSEMSPTAENELLQVVDANFDGYPDIAIFSQSGGAGPNNTENFFLFNPTTRQFVFDEELSSLPQIAIDSKTRTITSAQRDGCCRHSAETYRYMDGRLTLIANWDESLSADGKWLETTTGHLQNGTMHFRKTRKMENRK